jgi:hypothetical protein
METLSPTAPLFSAFVQDLAKYIVPHVVAELKAQTQAEGMGMIALDPNNLALPMYTVLKHDANMQQLIVDMIEDQYGHDLRSIGTKLDELDNKVDDIDVEELEGKVSTLEEKVGELEEHRGASVDADDNEFNDAVMTVLRNNI